MDEQLESRLNQRFPGVLNYFNLEQSVVRNKNIQLFFMPSFYKLIFITSLVGAFAIADNPVVNANNRSATNPASTGYSALKLFLEDEQHLTTIRWTKMVISFSGISDKSTKLIDNINDSSEQALEELEKLAAVKPSFVFKEFSDDTIGKATLDSLRMTTAREFLFESESFEKNLLLSQLNILRVISHLAKQLEEKETSIKRKAWLNKLADRYENYYQQIHARIIISDK